jgi:two-component system phosphate regulon sensor histidine kinase PhoR
VLRGLRTPLLATSFGLALVAAGLGAAIGLGSLGNALGVVVIAAAVAVAATATTLALVGRAAGRFAERARAIVRGGATEVASRPGGSPDGDDELGAWLDFLAADVRRSRSAVSDERDMLAVLLAETAVGVIAIDAAHQVVIVNDAARSLLGLAAAPIGLPILDVVRVPGVIDLVRAPSREPRELALPSGARVALRAVRHGDRLILLLDDVTVLRRLETVRRDFVANVSHELRTPVSIIRANAETLQGAAGLDQSMRTTLVDGLHRNAERLARILTDLLDLSRLDAGQYRLDASPIPVAQVAEAAIETVLPRAVDKGITIHRELDPALSALGDARALDQIVVNLVDNAVKYTPRGGNVWVRSGPGPSGVRLEVSDDGPGIAPRHRERIFERFYRVDAGRSRDLGGTGLGLAIVKHLGESMGGVVEVAAREPAGTTFVVTLPLSPPIPAANQV